MTRATKTQWAERVRRWKASGLTAEAFAAQRGFKGSTLLWWSSRLQRQERASFAQPEAPLAFVEVKLPTPGKLSDTVIEIEFRDGVRVRVGRQCETSHLQLVLAAARIAPGVAV